MEQFFHSLICCTGFMTSIFQQIHKQSIMHSVDECTNFRYLVSLYCYRLRNIRGLCQNSETEHINLTLFTAILIDFYVLFNDPLAKNTPKIQISALFISWEN